MKNPAMDRVRSSRIRTVFSVSVALLVSTAPAAWAEESTAKEGGLGMAAAITTLVYSPLKVAYAVGGTAASGLTWVFSGGDSRTANTVMTRAVRGTYVVTPEALRGEKPLEFVGRAPRYRSDAEPNQVAAAPEAW